MADIESNINLDIDASGAIASLKELQRQISVFQTTMAKTGAVSNARLSDMQHNLVNSINATGQFTASIQRVKTTTESFTQALEKNKLSMGQYFAYSMGATKTFGRGFKTEFDTIEKVARERVKTLQTQYIKLGRDASGAMQAIAVRPQVLDMKDLGTQTAIAAQKAQLFNQLMQQGSTNLLNFGKNTQWAGRQLMVGFTIPLGIMGAAAAKEFQAIEEQVIRLQRVYGDFTTTMADTEQITQQIKDLGSEFTKYGVAVSKTIGLAADAAAMGKTGADLVAQVAEANRLAVLGGVDQQQSLETTISLTNAFGVASDQLAGKINFLNAVENQTVTSIQDLTEAIPKAGPVVQQLGGNVEDLTFFLTAMKEGGINASEGANALKSGLASLINPTGEAVDMLAGFGVNLQGIVEANKGNVKGIVIDFAKALDTLDPLNRAQAIEQLFGKFQFSRLSTLFQNVIAEGSQASRVLDLTKASAAELASLSERELGRIEASPLFKYQAAIENFKAAIAPVGEEFMKAVTPLINFGTKILEGFNSWSDSAKQFAVIAIGAIGAIGPVLLMTFGLLANGLANVVKGVLFMRNAFRGAGTQSNVLTEQLNYMNSEQLQAAAVSASLNQVHNSLIQTFTSEAGAVRNLAAAYGQAISVQGGFMGPITTRSGGTKKAKGFASGGILRGPGTGTSDSIPAMLSNGEAIIPAKSVARYPEMVAGLISGNIPGFAKGTILDELKRRLRGAPTAISEAIKTEDYAYGSFDAEQKSMVNAIKKYGKANGLTESEINSQIASLVGMDRSHIGRSSKEVDVAGKKIQVKDWRTQDIQMDARAINQYATNLQESSSGPGAGKGSYLPSLDRAKIAGLAGIDVSDAKAMKSFNAEMDNLIAGGHPTTRMGYQALRGVAKHQVESESGNSQQARRRRTRAAGVSALLDTRMTDTSEGSYLKALEEGAMNPKEDKAANKKAKTEIDNRIKAAEKKILAEKEKEAKTQKQVTETATRRKKAVEKITSVDTSLAKDAEKAKKNTRREYKELSNGRFIDPTTGQFLSNAEVERRKKNEKARAEYARRKQATSEAAVPQQPRKPGVMSRLRGAMSPGRLGMAGMLASGALGGMSMMGGPMGDIAGQISGPLMAISGVASVLGMIPGPAGLVVAGLGAVAAVGISLQSALSEATQKAVDFQNSMGSGTKAINSLAEAAGNTTASQERDQQRQDLLSNLTNQKVSDPTFGQQYLDTENGKALVSDITSRIGKEDFSNIRRQIFEQMSTAIVSGAVSPEQARSIVVAFGEKLKDPNMAVGINAKLLDLFGPNGESLKDGSYEISMKIGKESLASLKSTFGKVSGGLNFSSWNPWENQENLGKAAGTMAALGATTLQQQQQLLDALDLEYQKRLEIAAATGDTSKIQDVQAQYEDQKLGLLKNQKQVMDSILQPYKEITDKYNNSSNLMMDYSVNDQKRLGAMGEAVDKQIAKTYEGDATQSALASVAKDAIVNAEGLGQSQEYQMKFLLSTGDIPPQTFVTLLDTFGKDSKVMNAALNLTSNLGTAEGGQMLQVMQSFQNEDGSPKEDVQRNFLAMFESRNQEEQIALSQFIDQITAVGGNFEVFVEMSVKNPDQFEKVQNDFAMIEAEAAKGPMVLETVLSQMTSIDEAGIKALSANQDWFNSLPPSQQKVYLTRYITTHEEVTPAQAVQYLKQQGIAQQNLGSTSFREMGMNRSGKKAQANYGYTPQQIADATAAIAAANAKQYVIDTTPQGSTAPPPPASYNGAGGGGGGGAADEKPAKSFLDSLVKDIRDFTNVTQGLTEDFESSMNAIRTASVSAFGGLSQQLRGLGLGEDVISLMTGMSKEEWDQYKGQFFNFDSAGNVTGFKTDLGLIAHKIQAITLGKFVDEQQKTLVNLGAQNTALTRLVGLGMSYANAYKLIEDAALAAAIANAKSADEIRQIIALAEQARKAKSLADSASSVAGTNAATDATQAGLAALVRFNSALSDTQVAAILANEDLQNMLANFDTLSADQLKILNEALQDAADKEALEIKIKMQTKEGMQELFNEGFNKAMEQFSAKEQEIKIKFKALRDPFQDVINSFTDQIEDMRNAPGGLDDLEADLQRIGEQEVDINKKYEERYKALDSIAKINERVAAQQRTQLSLAEALSMGDIAAAARAAEEMRAQDAAQALVDQRESLQKSQELELANITANMGLNREQIEARIRDINRQIFEIQEKQIEPAQYQLDLLTRQEETQINALTVAGQTKDEWEEIKNNIDLARTNSQQYNEAINLALGVVQDLQNAWKEVEKPKQTIHTIIEKRISEAEAAAAAKPAPAPAPVASTAPAPSGPVKDDAWVTSMARRVIRGEFGNGQARRNALGADYQMIQDRVNRILYQGYAKGGLVASYMANGGLTKPMFGPKGTDTVPAMLTPGEFVVKKWAVDRFGVNNLNAINQGNFGSGSVYNYNMSVNVRSDANPDEIARTVMAQIKRVDAQRIRGNRF